MSKRGEANTGIWETPPPFTTTTPGRKNLRPVKVASSLSRTGEVCLIRKRRFRPSVLLAAMRNAFKASTEITSCDRPSKVPEYPRFYSKEDLDCQWTVRGLSTDNFHEKKKKKKYKSCLKIATNHKKSCWTHYYPRLCNEKLIPYCIRFCKKNFRRASDC